MTEHSKRPVKLACILTGGPLYKIHVGKKAYVFELHPYMGPVPIHARTEEMRSISPGSWFWRAVTCWNAQGRKTCTAVRGPKVCVYRATWKGGRWV